MGSATIWSEARYDLNKIERVRGDLFQYAFGDYLGATPEGEDFSCMVHDVADHLKVPFRTVFESIRTAAGQRLTIPLAYTLSWRLAGNLSRLKKGLPVPPWVYQHEKEAVPIQVTASTLKRTKRGYIMAVNTVRVLAGTPAPMRLTAWWSKSFCQLLARRLGYTSLRGDFPYSHPYELVNMRMLVLLDPDKTRDGKPGFQEVRCTGTLQKWNRSIIEKRFRRQGNQPWPCPYGFDHYCYNCRIGYVDCEAATHRHTEPEKHAVSEEQVAVKNA
jgi:hypothetical protein